MSTDAEQGSDLSIASSRKPSISRGISIRHLEMSADVEQGSGLSIAGIQETSTPRGLHSMLERYLAEHDRSEVIRIGISHLDNVAASTVASKSRIKELILDYDAAFNGELRGSKGSQNKVEDLLDILTRENKDEQISEILSAHEQEREINVYLAHQLQPGENATWDSRNGEERTQPRRGPRQGEERTQPRRGPRQGEGRTQPHRGPRQRKIRHRSQTSAPDFSSSANGNRNRIQSQDLIPRIASPSSLQVLQSSEYDSNPPQAGEQAESASHPLGLVASSPEPFSGPSPSLSLQSSSLISNLWDNSIHQISNESPSLLPTSAIASAERSDLSGASLYCEPQTQIPAQQLDAGLIETVFTQYEETNFDEFLPANNFTPNTSDVNIFHPNDTSTSSTGPFTPLIRTSSLTSNALSLSRGKFVSWEAGFSPRLVNADALAAHAGEPLPSPKREEQADEDPGWFEDYIHEHAVEPTGK